MIGIQKVLAYEANVNNLHVVSGRKWQFFKRYFAAKALKNNRNSCSNFYRRPKFCYNNGERYFL